MEDFCVDILLDNINQIMHSSLRRFFDQNEIIEIDSMYKEFAFLRDFLKDTDIKCQREHKKVKSLVAQIIGLAHKAEDIINSLVVGSDNPEGRHKAGIMYAVNPKKRSWDEIMESFLYPYHQQLRNIGKEIESIKKEVGTIDSEQPNGIVVPRVAMSVDGILSRTSALEETVVGLDQEVETIRERLAGVSMQQLEVVSIVGMAGLGKTTLARKLYNDPFVVYHFYVRGWTYVSQFFHKRDSLLEILSSIVEHKDDIDAISDEKLGEKLYRCLKGKRYLIVVDDIWDIQAWNELKTYFPNDDNGSRILFTSRLNDLASHAKPNSPSPHRLRFLTPDESWDLLRLKVFRKESCPSQLMEVGKEIATKCRGLPLAIVVVAGLLAKTEKTRDWWKTVAESVNSHIVSDPKHCMDILALSYHHLPRHLKSCFIYLGAFLEDYEIPIRKLIWLWIAEGFIEQTEQKRVEDLAEEYLVDLIDRNLVLIAKTRSTGGTRSCRVHDLLRDFCLRKAKEEKFLQQIYSHEEPSLSPSSSSSSSSSPTNNHLFMSIENYVLGIDNDEAPRLCIHLLSSSSFQSSSSSHILNKVWYSWFHSRVFSIFSQLFTPHIRSFLFFAAERNPSPQNSMSFSSPAFKLLRVLELSAIPIHSIPEHIIHLVFLRYLALRGKNLTVPVLIAKLLNLETLIISEGIGTLIPSEIFKMKRLRHLCIAGENFTEALDGFSDLQTLSQVEPQGNINFAHIPNLRKLGFCGGFIIEDSQSQRFWFSDINFLNHLESLKLLNRISRGNPLPLYGQGYNLEGVKFPQNLKRLTLSLTYLEWKAMSTLGMLPLLEALKLEFQACVGPRWDTSDGGFLRLKYLKLYYMNLEQWNGYSTNFPALQSLVLHKCRKLKEIPPDLGDITSLHSIDLSWCSRSAVYSARQIQQVQHNNGNDWLQISINPPDWEL